MQTRRDEMSRFIAGGNALAIGTELGRGRSRGKGKSKGKGGARSRSSSAERAPRKGQDAESSAAGPSQDVCRFHLRGKCKAGNACSMKHNPPCRYFGMKNGCRLGDKCLFPHVKPTNPAAPATDGASRKRSVSGGTARKRNNSRQRSASKDRGGDRPAAAATTTLIESAQKTLDNTGLALTAFS